MASTAEPTTAAITRLKFFLQDICSSNATGSFVRRLAANNERWTSVESLLDAGQKVLLDEIAFQSFEGGFSSCNLKVHYVLDEDFIDGGSAFALFSLVGSTWSWVLRLKNQNDFIPTSDWLDGAQR